ncbi:M3 family oligoendopeptidase [Paenibacillus antri]|uniref:M3 family oligoendopeptidase n=1 Tax=Paenibacillus antri TaxID=2582848 RepID=A0A5R9GMW6_9BACL|nr:M3 family oligoendopeptidase [Paenibacillus antri]TLS53345.1 M3 family oligoendopeptidase [Paenibacillus antri]
MSNANRLPDTWDLDVIFPGGSDSPEFAEFLRALEQDIDGFGERVRLAADAKPPGAEALESLTGELESLQARLIEAEAFASCLASANQKDKKAVALGSAIRSLAAAFESRLTRFDLVLTATPQDAWDEWMRRPTLAPVAFPLTERRAQALEKMSPELETLLNDLAVDGYHGWSELYDTTVSLLEVPFQEENGDTTMLSAGQAQNKLYHPSKEVRDRTFVAWENAWEKHADYCAQALNHLGGFRLQTYKHRGWDSVHKEPLDLNRMSPETLGSMWSAIERNRSFLLDYFAKKAELLGIDKLGWTDLDAPIGKAGEKIGFDDGAALIVDQFRRFGPKLADFAAMTFRDRWIEAEDRPGKRPGGFCTSFPLKKQSRIFMTYEGSMTNVSTLAHELGHGFHTHVMYDQPQLTQNYAMGVAETASTFAEMIVSDATIRNASDRETKLALLDDKIQRSVAFLMNIHARFLFETNFYEERKRGTVGAERLNALMVDAQKQAFHDSLASYHPHFWASKLHFYITEVPFYNFPYTFGYLFSTGIYATASGEGANFEDRYVALLQDTGRMSVESLAKKHLNVDLTKPDFWERSVALMKKDVEDFLAL